MTFKQVGTRLTIWGDLINVLKYSLEQCDSKEYFRINNVIQGVIQEKEIFRKLRRTEKDEDVLKIFVKQFKNFCVCVGWVTIEPKLTVTYFIIYL